MSSFLLSKPDFIGTIRVAQICSGHMPMHTSTEKRPLNRPMIRAIAAMDQNRVIGNEQGLPWNVPEDLEHFRTLTAGATVAMGRATFESLPEGRRPLPNRVNVVFTRDPDKLGEFESVKLWSSVDEYLEACLAGKEQGQRGVVWIIGGEDVYRQALKYCDEVYLTLIHGEYPGDRKMPEFERDFELTACHAHGECTFLYYRRR